jgi:redox-sensitive bicupin YhaK (pirin superfamily)
MTEDLDRAVTGGLVPAGHGRELATGTTRPTVKVGPHSGSRLIGMLESDVPPGGAFPGHVHDDYEEVFYVLAGEIQYLIDNDWTQYSAASEQQQPVRGARGPAVRDAIAEPGARRNMARTARRVETIRPAS